VISTAHTVVKYQVSFVGPYGSRLFIPAGRAAAACVREGRGVPRRGSAKLFSKAAAAKAVAQLEQLGCEGAIAEPYTDVGDWAGGY